MLVDPKRVELNHYETLPHLLTPVVTNPAARGERAREPDRRDGEPLPGDGRGPRPQPGRAQQGPRRKEGEAPLPHILCVIDELADLMMVAPAEVEDSIIRLAQKSRAVGIHLVLATQRPSTDVITGTIKVNIPARIAFAVASQVDSRVILDQGGAETLLGQGDMLFRPIGTSKIQRIQGAFLTEAEIARLTSHWAKQGEPEFDEALLEDTSADGVEARRRRVLARPGRPARGRGADRGRERDRVGLDDPAPPAGGLHPRRAPDRHARAPRASSPATRARSRARCWSRWPTSRGCSGGAEPSRTRAEPDAPNPSNRKMRLRRTLRTAWFAPASSSPEPR